MSVYAFLKSIDNSINFYMDSWGLSLVLASSNPLEVSEKYLVLSSRYLILLII